MAGTDAHAGAARAFRKPTTSTSTAAARSSKGGPRIGSDRAHHSRSPATVVLAATPSNAAGETGAAETAASTSTAAVTSSSRCAGRWCGTCAKSPPPRRDGPPADARARSARGTSRWMIHNATTVAWPATAVTVIGRSRSSPFTRPTPSQTAISPGTPTLSSARPHDPPTGGLWINRARHAATFDTHHTATNPATPATVNCAQYPGHTASSPQYSKLTFPAAPIAFR
jgi:hypothetical protein